MPIPSPELLDDIPLGESRGGRRPATTACEVVRALTTDDLSRLNSRDLSPSANLPTLVTLRTAHHQLAQLLAQGRDQETVALITGYSPAYISRLKSDPQFRNLLDYYSAERAQIFVDVMERMKALGLSTLEELQQRLEDDPTQFSNRELHEQLKLLLVEPARPGSGLTAGAGPTASGVVVNVNFVASDSPRPTLDLQANAED